MDINRDAWLRNDTWWTAQWCRHIQSYRPHDCISVQHARDAV